MPITEGNRIAAGVAHELARFRVWEAPAKGTEGIQMDQACCV